MWPVGLESIQEDCLLNDPAICSDISDDEARIEVIEQAEFDRLEAALDRSFGKPGPEAEERENQLFFAEPSQAPNVESATKVYGENHELAGISLEAKSVEEEDKGIYERTTTNAPGSPTKRAAGLKSKGKRSFTIEEGRQEIEKRLNEMRRTEIDQVKTFCFSFVISTHQLLLQISFMLRSLSSSSLKEVVTKYLMSQPAKEVTVYINSFFNCAHQTPIVLLMALKLMIEKLALNDCRLKSLCETGTPPGHLCSSQESSSLTQILWPPPITFLLFWTPSDPIFVN